MDLEIGGIGVLGDSGSHGHVSSSGLEGPFLYTRGHLVANRRPRLGKKHRHWGRLHGDGAEILFTGEFISPHWTSEVQRSSEVSHRKTGVLQNSFKYS